MKILKTTMKSRIYCKTTSCRRWANLNEKELCPTCASSANEVEEQEGGDCKCNYCDQVVSDNDNKVIGCDLCDS